MRAVLFIEKTLNGELARRTRDDFARLGMAMGYKIKVVERPGKTIANQFSHTNLWRGLVCGTEECITCN